MYQSSDVAVWDGIACLVDLDVDGIKLYLTLFILLQFTGLHDKNGKEIYEGDIVKYEYVPWNTGGLGSEMRYAEVYFEDGRFCISGSPKDWIVVGNIYENSDLLGE
jgi:uncharacterized phage protein (TIGR01671 family)